VALLHVPLIAGTRFCGKVDQVPGHFYVATLFAHLWWLPLAPLRSCLVFEDHAREDDQDSAVSLRYQVIRLPLSWKSLLFAYLRLILVVGWATAGLFLLVFLLKVVLPGQAAGGPAWWDDVALSGGLFVGLPTLLLASYRLTYAGEKRALQLARLACTGKIVSERARILDFY
jgi:hypothetical protein